MLYAFAEAADDDDVDKSEDAGKSAKELKFDPTVAVMFHDEPKNWMRRVNVGLLLSQWLMVVLMTLGLVWTLSDSTLPHAKSDSAEVVGAE